MIVDTSVNLMHYSLWFYTQNGASMKFFPEAPSAREKSPVAVALLHITARVVCTMIRYDTGILALPARLLTGCIFGHNSL